MFEIEYLVMKVRDAAAGGVNALSTGEALAAALVLNRADWLAERGFTIAGALDRVGPEWVALIPAAAKMIEQANAVLSVAAMASRDESTLSNLSAADTVVDVCADLVTYGNAPGYRDVNFTLDVRRAGTAEKYRLCVQVGAQDGESMAKHILEVHRMSWEGRKPIDQKPGEKRPSWIA
jgi:hypothetical protein